MQWVKKPILVLKSTFTLFKYKTKYLHCHTVNCVKHIVGNPHFTFQSQLVPLTNPDDQAFDIK